VPQSDLRGCRSRAGSEARVSWGGCPISRPSGVSLKQRGGLRYAYAGSSLAIASAEQAISSAPLEYSAP